MNFPEIVDIALPAEGVFHNLVFRIIVHQTFPTATRLGPPDPLPAGFTGWFCWL
jgi:hypothetical protein